MRTPYDGGVEIMCKLDRECAKMGIEDWRMRAVVYANMWDKLSPPLVEDKKSCLIYLSTYCSSHLLWPSKTILWNHCMRSIQQFPLDAYIKPDFTFAVLKSYEEFTTKLGTLAKELTNQEIYK